VGVGLDWLALTLNVRSVAWLFGTKTEPGRVNETVVPELSDAMLILPPNWLTRSRIRRIDNPGQTSQ
jgi:hypothetical protein